uniref:Uncharacterized protein n=1 Tax=Romanomermis culicivorax TaxID=13658 RepID=A0A915IRB2_ROMCU
MDLICVSHYQDEFEKKIPKPGSKHVTISDYKSEKEKLVETVNAVIKASAIPDYRGPDSPKYVVAMPGAPDQKAGETLKMTSADRRAKKADRSLDRKGPVNKKTEENPKMVVRKKADTVGGDGSKPQQTVGRRSSRPVVTEQPKAVDNKDVTEIPKKKIVEYQIPKKAVESKMVASSKPTEPVVKKEPTTIKPREIVKEITVMGISQDIPKDMNGCGFGYLPNQPCNCESFIEKQRLKTTICSIM